MLDKSTAADKAKKKMNILDQRSPHHYNSKNTFVSQRKRKKDHK